jgi:GNAT superfamily N-acetyltransferase
MSLSITPVVHTDEAAVRALNAIITASTDHDLPGFPLPTERLTYLEVKHDWVGRRHEHYLAETGGRPVARLDATFPTLDNLNNMFITIDVLPEFRRRGIGRALFGKAAELARANGRTKLMGGAPWELPGIAAHDKGAGTAFCQAMGFESGNAPEVMRRFDLSALDRKALDDMLSHAKERSAGYEVIRWIDEAPDEYLDDIAYLDGRLLEDAPTGDMEWEPEKVDADRIRAGEKVAKARARISYHTGAVHKESNTLVAWTTLACDLEREWHCWQQITIVEPRHRGHRLGALVKVENLLWYLEQRPQTRVIDTFNAAENGYMISINEQMGFRPLFAFQNWQRDL